MTAIAAVRADNDALWFVRLLKDGEAPSSSDSSYSKQSCHRRQTKAWFSELVVLLEMANK